ncbi:MAG TPA: COX15/CtaA family protein [Burkholderiales bacterium]|nr:COX15/CtaA family protein [Burkholderiales bacterium]
MIFRKLVVAAAILAYAVVVFGAFVRLSDAGLGCPDWPGCYGHVAVPQSAEARGLAQLKFPDRPLDNTKAWIEMMHRYLAGTLGLLILANAVYAVRKRAELQQSPALPLFLAGLVVLQALLGMWTVTLLLKPVVVSLHLLGGMATLALLCWLGLLQYAPQPTKSVKMGALRFCGWLGLVLLVVQIALGGWVSVNYAGLACGGFPLCDGSWVPDMDFASGFQFLGEQGMIAKGGPSSSLGLTAIHWIHRLGALIVLCYLASLVMALQWIKQLQKYGALLLIVLCLQIALGIGNVWLGLPLLLAVAHNAVAALLLVVMVVLNFKLTSFGSDKWRQA